MNHDRNSRSICAGSGRRLWADRSGVSAIEFSFICPLLIMLCLGCVAAVNGVILQRKVSQIAGTMANLVTQNVSVSSSTMSTYFGASTLIAAPYSSSPLTIVISCISIDSSGNATVSWSTNFNGSARSVGSSVTLPTAINVASTSLIMSEVTYRYTPSVGTNIIGAVTLSKTMYMSPRLSSTVSYSS